MSPSIHWFVRQSPLLMALVDETLTCRELSNGWRANLTISEDAISGKGSGNGSDKKTATLLTDLITGTGSELLQPQLKALFHSHGKLHEIPVALHNNRENTVGLLSAWPTPTTHDKTPSLILHVAVDPKCAETLDELARIQSRHQLILDAAGDGVYGLDRNGRCTFANDAAEDILGWCRKEVIGQVIHDIHHHTHLDGSHYPKEDCPIYAATQDGEIHRVDTEVFWHINGSPVPVEYTSTPIWKDGELDGAVIVFRNISQRKQMEQLRSEAYAEICDLKEQLEQERDYLRDEINVSVNFGDIIGESQALQRTLAQVESVAETTATVLILGESGVGKEMIARAIHANSPRADKPLVKVNCASVPHDLFESEFFGHVRGSFTGAHQDRTGRLQLADGGTLFLDEIGEIPLNQQGKLLRALQEHEFERVGDDKTITADVRIVAATNRDLIKEVKAGRFREDLYYRLSVFPIELAPLRHRQSDIVPLAHHFLESVCQDFGRPQLGLTQQQADSLSQHHWPGNIRELKNVIERAVILSKGKRLRLDLAMPELISLPADISEPESNKSDFLTESSFRELEKSNLIAALEYANWKIAGEDGAAALLGIKPPTLAYRMGVFKIKKK
ncbi:MAG: sigma 54-interacting transcriptional regulator [Pseudomonadales bacterium]|nr:sigma 54-interacting transcriptional regulator [Pseudomonadales bacterium]